MKHLFLLLLILPLSLFATMYNGTVTLNNGTVKNGLIRIPKYNSGKIRFKENAAAGTEKISINDVKEFVIFDAHNKAITYVPVKTSNPGWFNRHYKTRVQKSWLQLIKRGKINLLVLHYTVPAVSSNVSTVLTPCYGVYVQKQEDDFCSYIYLTPLGHRITTRDYKDVKATLNLLFNTVCPKMITSFKEDDFKFYGPELIANLYNAHCSN